MKYREVKAGVMVSRRVGATDGKGAAAQVTAGTCTSPAGAKRRPRLRPTIPHRTRHAMPAAGPAQHRQRTAAPGRYRPPALMIFLANTASMSCAPQCTRGHNRAQREPRAPTPSPLARCAPARHRIPERAPARLTPALVSFSRRTSSCKLALSSSKYAVRCPSLSTLLLLFSLPRRDPFRRSARSAHACREHTC